MAANWPTSLDSDANLYVAVNELQTNLSGSINAAVTTIGINSVTSFPTAGAILVDNEVIHYTGISGANLTGCTRGFDGTTAATHSAGAIVSHAIIADHHNAVKDAVIAVESYLDTTLGKGTITTAAEFGHVHGVTSAIQTQLNAKQATLTNGQLPGTATFDNALAGMVGEYVSSVVSTNQNLPTASQLGDLTSISLTAGDWDVTGTINFRPGSGPSLIGIGISITSGNSTTGLVEGSNLFYTALSGSPSNFGACIPSYRASLNGTTTVYLKHYFEGSGTPTDRGCLSARRVR